MIEPEKEIRQSLRDWIVGASGKIAPDELKDETPIIERRIITSLQVLDLILFLEKLRGEPIDVGKLQTGVFKNVNAIYAAFFAARSEEGGTTEAKP